MLTPFDASLGAGRCRSARLLEVTRPRRRKQRSSRRGNRRTVAPQNRGRRARVSVSDDISGPPTRRSGADPAGHPSWSGARGELDRGAPSRGVSYGRFRPHDLPVSSGRFVSRLPRESPAIPSRIAVALRRRCRRAPEPPFSPRKISRPPHRCLPRTVPLSIRQSSVLFSFSATAYPAYIPRDVAGTFRRYPAIPAKARTQSPALAGNPRLSPPSPELPRPACHAGGRGFESRRSRLLKCLLSCGAAAASGRVLEETSGDRLAQSDGRGR